MAPSEPNGEPGKGKLMGELGGSENRLANWEP
jgi:hypothetical protein